jgi:hypothetical protein
MSSSDDDVRILADIEVASLIFAQVDSFPPNPPPGLFVVKDGVFWGYVKVNPQSDFVAWCPFGRIPVNYVHMQTEAASQWTVEHGLGATDCWVQVKDMEGVPVDCSQSVVSPERLVLQFLRPTAGSCLVMANITHNSG